MNNTNSGYEVYIKPLKIRFWLTAALFLVVALLCTSLVRARGIQDKTSSELVRAGSGLDKLKQANANRLQALATLKTQLGNSAERKSPERIIYEKVDEIKERLKPDDLSVAAIEKKGGDVSLAYTLKFSNSDYNKFLNAISYLQESRAPLTPANSVTITKTETPGKSDVLFSITGKVLTSEKSKP